MSNNGRDWSLPTVDTLIVEFMARYGDEIEYVEGEFHLWRDGKWIRDRDGWVWYWAQTLGVDAEGMLDPDRTAGIVDGIKEIFQSEKDTDK